MAQTLSGMLAKILDRLRPATPASRPQPQSSQPKSSQSRTSQSQPSQPQRSGTSSRPSAGSHSAPAGKPAPRPSGSGHGAPAVDDPSLAGVTFEYNPSLDGDADPGEVVWTWVPWEEDPTQGKDRPVVIVGRRGRLLVGVPLTSKPHDNERQVPVGTGPWDREGRPSFAKIERILDVDPGQVRREGSILSRAHYDDVVAALRHA